MKKIVLKTGKRTRFAILVTGLLLSIFFRYVLQVNIFSVMLLAIPILIAVLGDRDEILAMCVCCVPFYLVLQIHYVVVICILVYMCKYPRDIKLDFTFILILMLVTWEVAHCFWGDLNFKLLIVFLIPYILLTVLISIRNIDTDYGFIVRSYSIAVCSVCFVLVARLLILSDFDFNVAFANMTRLGLRGEDETTEVIINPNSLGVMCTLGITGFLQIRRFGQRKSYDLYIMLAMLIMGTLTVSRTYLACLIIMAVLFLMSLKGDVKQKTRYLLSCAAVITVAILIITFAFPSVIETFIARFQVEDVTSGRTDLFSQYNDYLVSSPRVLLYGMGVMDFRNKLVPITNSVPHNCIQEILLAWGIPGFVMFVSLIIVMVWRSKKENPRQTLVHYIPLVIFLAKGQVGQVITSTYTMLSLAFVYLSLCANDYSNKGQN